MRFALVLAMLAICLAFVKSDPDSCVEFPAVIPFGGICNGGIGCQFGSYCSFSSVCTVNVKAGDECDYSKTCEHGTSCKGVGEEVGFKQMCVLDAHPGQDCAGSQSFVPDCGGGLSCNYPSQTCSGGQVGDSCWKDQDCLSDMCDEATRTCSPIALGKKCVATGACALGSFCDTSSGVPDNYKCKALKTSETCDTTAECAFGYACFRAKSTDDYKCHAVNTKEPGTYCESGVECASKRCINGYCATKNVEYCQASTDCSTDQRCNCNGRVFAGGIGKCVDFPCAKMQADFANCINDHCHSPQYFNGSCALNNCKTMYDQLNICSDASGLIASLVSVAFATFFASFFSKRI